MKPLIGSMKDVNEKLAPVFREHYGSDVNIELAVDQDSDSYVAIVSQHVSIPNHLLERVDDDGVWIFDAIDRVLPNKETGR